MFARHADFRAFLLSAARANGAIIRFGCKVSAVDEECARVTLSDGGVIQADVVVGADGTKSVMRDTLFEGEETVQDTGLVMFK
jgi:2-polyprenyl-6-methoxyphenol hydroxylase-like FAD-dependent oxidoreductase